MLCGGSRRGGARNGRTSEPVNERKITGSMIAMSFVLGFVLVLTYEELMTTTQKETIICPGEIELQNLLRTVGQYQYYNKLMEAGLDRIDILAESQFEDVKSLSVKPYHWAKMKSEAMRRILKRKISIIGLLENEHLGDAGRGKTSLSDELLGDTRDASTLASLFINIEPGEYIPHVTINHPTVTTVCTGSIVERLFTLFNALHLANILESRLHIIWSQDDNCGSKLTSLLSFSKMVSISTLSPGRNLSDVFIPTSLHEFDAVYTTRSGVVASLLVKEDDYSTSRAEDKPLGLESPIVMWAKRNIDDVRRSHILHSSPVMSPGVTSSSVAKAVTTFEVRISNEVTQTLKRHLETNEVTSDNSNPVYEDHITDPLSDFLKDRKLILIPVAGYTLSKSLHLPSLIYSFYNASQPGNELTAVGQLASASLFSTSAVYSTETIRDVVQSRPESQISKMLCDVNILKCDS